MVLHNESAPRPPFCGSRHFNTHLPACCNRCQFPVETLQHILNLCQPSYNLYTKRHDAIVIRVARALIWTQHLPEAESHRAHDALSRRYKTIGLGLGSTLFLDKTLPTCSGILRPDITLLNGAEKLAIIIDVTIPFEADSDTFAAARAEKIFKYRAQTAELNTAGFRVVLGAIVVGSLGAWDPVNKRLLKECGCPTFYIREMAEFFVSKAIGLSREIYNQHIHGSAATGSRLQAVSEQAAGVQAHVIGGVLVLPAVHQPPQQPPALQLLPPVQPPQPAAQQAADSSQERVVTAQRRSASTSGIELRVTVQSEEAPTNKRGRQDEEDADR